MRVSKLLTGSGSQSPYHDLALGDGQHLEAHFWWQPSQANETAGVAFTQIAAAVPGLLRGAPIFRSLPTPESLDPVRDAKPSVQRGGCTWLLDIEVLGEAPNLMAAVDGDPCRRSDMVWCTLLARQFGRKIVQVPLAVDHDRSGQQVGHPWRDLMRDVRGHAVHLALTELLDRVATDGTRPPLQWSDEELTWVLARFRYHLEARVEAFAQSLPRIRTLLRAIRARLQRGEGRWWLACAEYAPAVAQAVAALDGLEALVDETAAAAWLQSVRRTADAPIRDFAVGLEPALRNWRTALQNRSGLLAALESDRKAIALGGVQAVCAPDGPLRVLGMGREGVVVTDGRHVFKWYDGLAQRHRNHLRRLGDLVSPTASLPHLDGFFELAGHCVVRYPFQPSTEYRGGEGPSLVKLLRECRDAGIVCNNLHPKNLRVTADGLLLVDLGADIVPWTPAGWVAMCRRAFLSWRWSFRSDLEQLMTRSLREANLPELTGLEGLQRALDNPPAQVGKRQYLCERVTGLGARTVLDYGCGPGRLACELASMGIQVTGFDPDGELAARWRESEAAMTGVQFGHGEMLDSVRAADRQFDVVLCSLVLCILDDGPLYESALADVARFVQPDGRVLVAVCNPFATFGGSTPFKTRPEQCGASYDDTFRWVGASGGNGRERHDVHRPLWKLERDLLRHGLAVETRWFSETVDLQRFEPASDFAVLTLRPVPKPAAEVTLAIKSCVMEWRTLEEQVRHLLRQLEGDFAFAERLLVIDSRRGVRTGTRHRRHRCLRRHRGAPAALPIHRQRGAWSGARETPARAFDAMVRHAGNCDARPQRQPGGHDADGVRCCAHALSAAGRRGSDAASGRWKWRPKARRGARSGSGSRVRVAQHRRRFGAGAHGDRAQWRMANGGARVSAAPRSSAGSAAAAQQLGG